MQIYVVQQGDTVFSIANTYGITPDEIIQANELESPNDLVVGQALVLPILGQFYQVRSGDTLDSLAAHFHQSKEEIARVNQIPLDIKLTEGMTLYIPEGEKRPITSFAYLEPLGESVSQTLINATRKHTPDLTYLALFSFRVNRDGSLNPPPLNHLKEIAKENGAALSLVVTNLEGDSFSTELGRIILTVNAVQDTLLEEIVNTAQEGGYTDVHFDFEFLPRDMRENYNSFLRKARARFKQAGLLLSTALAPKISPTQEGLLY